MLQTVCITYLTNQSLTYEKYSTYLASVFANLYGCHLTDVVSLSTLAKGGRTIVCIGLPGACKPSDHFICSVLIYWSIALSGALSVELVVHILTASVACTFILH